LSVPGLIAPVAAGDIGEQEVTTGTTENSELLRIKDVARQLTLSKNRVYALMHLGELQGVKLGPRGLRVAASSVRQFIDRNRIK
jgi:excisionase family DNA binding protein